MEEEKAIWWRWCRLCARENPEQNIDISSNIEIATAIGKFFWVNIKSVDITHYICHDCHTMVNLLSEFTERVNKVQAMLCMLQNAKTSEPLDPYEVRSQYDLLDEDWEHFIRSEALKEKLTDDDGNTFDDRMRFDDPDQEFEEAQFVTELGDKEEETENVGDNLVDFKTDTESVETASQDQKTENINDYENDREESVLVEDCAESIEQENESVSVEPIKERSNEVIESVTELKENPRVRNSYCKRVSKTDHLGYSTRKRRIVSDVNKAATPRCGAKDRKFSCSVCGKNYKNPTSYRKHMVEAHNLEADLPDFVCDKCNKIFPTDRQLFVHSRSHLPLEKKLVVPCPFCEKKFTMESVMKLHVNSVHNNEKPYICEQCGQGLKSMASFNDHKLVHTDECPHECEICKKKFKSKARLKIHMDTHPETIYTCNQCGLQLNTKRTLKMHMLVHSEEKAFKCDLCDAEFKRIKALKNHLIVHIGLRPYKCNFCGKTFTNGSNCRTHKKKLHPVELAEEEASGFKKEPTSVPKISELRSCDVVQKPRIVHRSYKGLTPKMRALLIAAEQRRKGKDAMQPKSKEVTEEKVQPNQVAHYKLQETGEEAQLIDEEDDEHSEYYEEDCSETVIYEIIDEVKL